ncbi:MAG: metal-dependent transcriptional regulator [Candidatus Riflebacteria bacterium]|nr:metal-dependent transcriptional regulator [Candidatus Riflebacteria bacterium]
MHDAKFRGETALAVHIVPNANATYSFELRAMTKSPPPDRKSVPVTTKKQLNELSTALESYLEEIKSLQEKYGAVRVTDLAERMSRRLPSVTSALRRLSQLELINYESYRPVTLTQTGEAAVRRLDGRHRILADFFLTLLALPEDLAEEEACKLEHRISPAVLRRLGRFMEFVRSDPAAKILIEERHFEAFIGRGK